MTTHNRNEELVLAHFEAHATDEQKQAAKAAGNGKPTEDVEAFSRKILRRVREAYRADREGSVKRG